MIASFNLSRTLAGAAGTLLFAGLCIGGATAPAAAAPIQYGMNEAGQRIAHVNYKDIDLASAQGRATLENRLRAAARSVCRNDGRDPFASMEAHRCYQETVRSTRAAAMAAIESEKQTG